ncbi:MAG: phenylalanine--tRNA ligase subunit beta [Pirellulaceae bacterium]|jgi:phenylalanyl-tRNA synthetase beta chain|nr:phenylalanine--tRNA ligase subunit beta [Planctomycetaceae bacterium]MDP6467596.1 phenylalanine--tRNA ligase subunit beta [Pirellulaceae bacterium]MDP6554722.1 phenylalanine--tRNA ligase subunit beta [Pirellulaceae bacterium]MDP6720176.1 phenylalanine--tRNA ligase subunit beta [Pirellulaceae bacterium]
MIVSWNWLKDFVKLDLNPAEVEQRLMMAGLNHEGTESIGDDLAIDLEVTSNRPDCLGHLGVAREIGVLFQRPLTLPAAQPTAAGPAVNGQIQVRIDCPALCYRYTARVIRKAKIGPSPDWLASRLRTIGITVINNVVDISNYVMMECGQPLHAFDLATINGQQIIVREAAKGEKFEAIDHNTYQLEPGMCVIADGQRAVALGGVMGGAESEVSQATTDLLIEAAEFAPLSIRKTARSLNLHSPSSYRFERTIDPAGVDWASRRCCELILDLAGGELADGVVDVGNEIVALQPVVLRLPQLERILGITVPQDEVRRILTALGNHEESADNDAVQVIPPSWRRDLTREIDLIEEVARIHGYDQIPEDVAVPMWPSNYSDAERVLDKLRRVMTGAGFDEAITASLAPQEWGDRFSPWTERDPIVASMPMKGILADAPNDLGQADKVRTSLLPSLLEARRYNESVGNVGTEMFETAKVYLPREGDLPVEPWTLAIVSSGGFLRVKGVIERLVATLNPTIKLEVQPTKQSLLDHDRSAELRLKGRQFGFLGEIAPQAGKQFGLRTGATVAELRIASLEEIAVLIPQYAPQIPYPTITRDLNLIVDEQLLWSDLASTVKESAGEFLETTEYKETYRREEQDGTGKKRLLFSVIFRSAVGTLTNEEVDQIRDRIVAASLEAHGAKLLV